MTGAALVAAALLAAGIYYLAAPSRSSGPVLTAPRVETDGSAPLPTSPTTAPVGAATVAVATVGALRDAPPPPTLVNAHQAPKPTPTPDPAHPLSPAPSQDAEPTAPVVPVGAHRDAPPSPPLILSLSKDAPSVATGPDAISIGGKLQAPDSAPQPPGSGSDDQVQFTPDKPAQQYPNLSSQLNRLATAGEAGQTTAQQSDQFAAIQQDDPVAVTIHLSANVDDVVTFLEANGGDPRNVGEDYIEAYVPIPLLGSLSQQPGVLRVREIVPPQGASPPATDNPGRP